jgi:hypothetical protein
MIDLLHDLIRHKAYANRRHEPAAQDPELRKLLHHIILADRFWLLLTLGVPSCKRRNRRSPNRSKQSQRDTAKHTRRSWIGGHDSGNLILLARWRLDSSLVTNIRSLRPQCRCACTATVTARNAQSGFDSSAARLLRWILFFG